MRTLLLIGLWLMAVRVEAQDTTSKWQVRGYLKDLRTLIHQPAAELWQTDNLLHNRLQVSWLPHQQLELRAELRNRMFYGETVRSLPNYSDLIQTDDYLTLSKVWVDKPAMVVHSVLDRAYIRYRSGLWEITAGRQRVNWGINTVWNPNDLFNAFSYVDFDYEERPGSDAIRLQRYYGFASRLEVAATLADSLKDAVIAGLWAFHAGKYDWQILGGIADGYATAGVGWAGAIKSVGFKGEATVFHPYTFGAGDQTDVSATLSFDYSFPKGTYVLVSALYNTAASQLSGQGFLNFQPSARLLSPFPVNTFVSIMHPLTPLLMVSGAAIYSPTNHTTFLNPGITYSIATNWDWNLIGQFMLDGSGDSYRPQLYLFFTRLKWSF